MRILFLLLLCCATQLAAQYPPAAGQPGTTAIHKDSSVFVAWATGAEIIRGPQQIDNPDPGPASAGTPTAALGKAGTTGIVSLGDGGSAILTFEYPIKNGSGWDFAVFENSFDGLFLELAFVEVSSDGSTFFRFPAASLTDTSLDLGGFGTLEAEKLNNLAGKYVQFYGTPFDLEELAGTPGLDVDHITHVKVIDVVGTNDPAYCTRDAEGRKVIDPWPTPFASSGFDLDAVGVIHDANPNPARIHSPAFASSIKLYPQPAGDQLTIECREIGTGGSAGVYTLSGSHVLTAPLQPVAANTWRLSLGELPAGMYILEVPAGNTRLRRLIVVG